MSGVGVGGRGWLESHLLCIWPTEQHLETKGNWGRLVWEALRANPRIKEPQKRHKDTFAPFPLWSWVEWHSARPELLHHLLYSLFNQRDCFFFYFRGLFPLYTHAYSVPTKLLFKVTGIGCCDLMLGVCHWCPTWEGRTVLHVLRGGCQKERGTSWACRQGKRVAIPSSN